jgi:DNA-binding transcriptional MerR regulator
MSIKRTLTIHDVAAAVDRAPNTIRRYERLGILPPPARDLNGWRRYSKADLDRIAAIIYPEEHKCDCR